MIELEVIVSVHETRQHDRTVQIDHGVAALWLGAEREDRTREPHRVVQPNARYPRYDTGIDERRGGAPPHSAFVAWITRTTGGLPHRRRNASTEGSSLGGRRGSRIAWTWSPASSRAHRWSSIVC